MEETIFAKLYSLDGNYHIEVCTQGFLDDLSKLNPETVESVEGNFISQYIIEKSSIDKTVEHLRSFFSGHAIDIGYPHTTARSASIILPKQSLGNDIQYKHVLEQIPLNKLN